MARPFKCRRVAFLPGVTYFKPAGVPMRLLEEVILSVEEAEAIRVKDIENLEQEQCGERMNISRPTFQRVLYSARRKIADALLNGKAIRIEGGNFETASGNNEMESDAKRNEKEFLIGRENMKIAVVTDDGKTISQHFGRAGYYLVVTVEDGRVVHKEQRPKAGHHGEHLHESHASAGARHGFDAHAQASHAGMMANIADCQLVIAGGMGWGAQESLKQAGIDVFMTDKTDIDEAINLYLQGILTNMMDRLH